MFLLKTSKECIQSDVYTSKNNVVQLSHLLTVWHITDDYWSNRDDLFSTKFLTLSAALSQFSSFFKSQSDLNEIWEKMWTSPQNLWGCVCYLSHWHQSRNYLAIFIVNQLVIDWSAWFKCNNIMSHESNISVLLFLIEEWVSKCTKYIWRCVLQIKCLSLDNSLFVWNYPIVEFNCYSVYQITITFNKILFSNKSNIIYIVNCNKM